MMVVDGNEKRKCIVMAKDYSLWQEGLENMPDDDFEVFMVVLQTAHNYTNEDIEIIRHNRKLQKKMGGA